MKVSLKLRWLFHTKIRNQKQIINISDSGHLIVHYISRAVTLLILFSQL